jgi:hypothetical protein
MNSNHDADKIVRILDKCRKYMLSTTNETACKFFAKIMKNIS